MSITQFYSPVRLSMGAGSIQTLPTELKRYGNKCLLVAQASGNAMLSIRDRIATILKDGGVEIDFFSEIRPNPLISDIEKGIKMVRENNYDAIVAVGGGSVIDTAKVLRISKEYDFNWEELFKSPMLKPVNKVLPLISIPTTAGTGSHCTPAAVISDNNNTKHSIYSFDFFSTVAIVDYTLTMSLPAFLTATTGFDAFCHLSESYIMGKLSPIMEMLNLQAQQKLIDTLPKLVLDNKPEYREIMSVVDSCAGMSLSNGGAILPHAFGEAISSNVYRINHGSSLALVYPSFVEHFFNHTEYGCRIQRIISLLNKDNINVVDGKSARRVMENFIKSLNIKLTLADYDVTSDELNSIKSALNNQKRFKPEEVEQVINDICSSSL